MSTKPIAKLIAAGALAAVLSLLGSRLRRGQHRQHDVIRRGGQLCARRSQPRQGGGQFRGGERPPR